jgi:uncharacterized protein (TIGR02246 family)
MRPYPVVAVALLAAACAGPPEPAPAPDLTALAQEVLAAEAAELAAWEARDIEGIMNAYAPDAIVMAGGGPGIGREPLRQLFVDFLADPGFTLTFRSDPPLMAASGELGVTVGTYALTYTDPAGGGIGRRTGHHLMSWQRQDDGQWRVVRQMTVHDR